MSTTADADASTAAPAHRHRHAGSRFSPRATVRSSCRSTIPTARGLTASWIVLLTSFRDGRLTFTGCACLNTSRYSSWGTAPLDTTTSPAVASRQRSSPPVSNVQCWSLRRGGSLTRSSPPAPRRALSPTATTPHRRSSEGQPTPWSLSVCLSSSCELSVSNPKEQSDCTRRERYHRRSVAGERLGEHFPSRGVDRRFRDRISPSESFNTTVSAVLALI